jgi:hypothetical protein
MLVRSYEIEPTGVPSHESQQNEQQVKAHNVRIVRRTGITVNVRHLDRAELLSNDFQGYLVCVIKTSLRQCRFEANRRGETQSHPCHNQNHSKLCCHVFVTYVVCSENNEALGSRFHQVNEEMNERTGGKQTLETRTQKSDPFIFDLKVLIRQPFQRAQAAGSWPGRSWPSPA